MSDPSSLLHCVGCGVPIVLAAPDRAVAFGCASCGTVLDLSGHRPYPLGQVRAGLHGPEGLVEIGRRGSLGDRQIIVAGRLRLGVFQGAAFIMLDDWQIVSRDGYSLWLREREGRYQLLVPADLGPLPSPQEVAALTPGELVRLGPVAGRVLGIEQLRVLHVEGEQHQTLSLSSPSFVVRLESPSGEIMLRYCGGAPLAFTVQPLEDRAMWAIFDYTEIRRAHDALFVAQERAERRAVTVARCGNALLLCALFGAIAAGALVASGDTVKEGWARHDFRARDGLVEIPMESVPLEAGLGIYTLTGECGLDPASQELTLVAESPTGRRVPLVACRRAEPGRAVGVFTSSFVADETGLWRMISVHDPDPSRGGRAHLTFKLTWQLGRIGPLLYVLLALLGMGLSALVAAPISRRAGLRRLEESFEVARAEMVLALRRRSARVAGPPEDDR